MKKAIPSCLIFLLIAVALLVAGGAAGAYAAPLSDNLYDTAFLAAIDELAPREGYASDAEVIASRELLYDAYLNELGIIYDFSIDGEDGYGIMIVDGGVPELSELYFNKENPYRGCDYPVYLMPATYARCEEGELRLIGSDQAISAETLEMFSSVIITGQGGPIEHQTWKEEYITKQVNGKHSFALRIPAYAPIDGHGCCPIAGTNLIAYYDRFYENLIEDYTPGTEFGSSYIYDSMGPALDRTEAQLAVDMNTSSQGGTTAENTRNGISAYCARKGLTASFYTCVNSNSLYEKKVAYEYMDQGKPILLFLLSFGLFNMVEKDGTDYVDVYYYKEDLHSMVAFGYYDVTYTYAKGSPYNCHFLQVASGLRDRPSCYFQTNLFTYVVEAYAVNIA